MRERGHVLLSLVLLAAAVIAPGRLAWAVEPALSADDQGDRNRHCHGDRRRNRPPLARQPRQRGGIHAVLNGAAPHAATEARSAPPMPPTPMQATFSVASGLCIAKRGRAGAAANAAAEARKDRRDSGRLDMRQA